MREIDTGFLINEETHAEMSERVRRMCVREAHGLGEAGHLKSSTAKGTSCRRARLYRSRNGNCRMNCTRVSHAASGTCGNSVPQSGAPAKIEDGGGGCALKRSGYAVCELAGAPGGVERVVVVVPHGRESKRCPSSARIQLM
jgi:hypothetical protein